MVRHKHLAASCLATLLTTTALQADVTAQGVWDNWKSLGQASGQSFTAASEQMSGDTLTVTGVDINSTFEGGSVVGRIDMLAFRELGDGTVEVTMSPDYTMTLNTIGDSGEPVAVGLAISQPGLVMIASGDETTTAYSFTADGMTVATTSVTENGVAMPFDLALTGTNAKGRYEMTAVAENVVSLVSDIAFASAALSVNFADPDAQSEGSMQGAMEGLTLTSSGT
jgi:hypothetical protein